MMGSQSLLRQGECSNGPLEVAVHGSYPSQSLLRQGECSNRGLRGHRAQRRSVSIPSSSGRVLEQEHINRAKGLRLTSQSLLRQGECSNLAQCLRLRRPCVSIPSSSGRVLEQLRLIDACRTGWVSIPSSSGRVLERRPSCRRPAHARRLNPFFVRASARTTGRDAKGFIRWRVSIPSSSGRVLERAPKRHGAILAGGLNPFFVRASARTGDALGGSGGG